MASSNWLLLIFTGGPVLLIKSWETFGAGAPVETSAGPVHARTPRPSREQPRGAADLANLASFLSRSSADLAPILISCSAGAHISPSAMEGRIPRASMDVDLTPPCFTARFAIGCSPLTNPHPWRLQLPHVSCFCLAADEPDGDGRHRRLLQNRRTLSCCNRLKKSFSP